MKKKNIFITILTFTLLLGIINQPPSVHAQTLPPEENRWKEIAVGSSQSIGIKDDVTVWNWGNTTTYRGELGSETNLNSLIPK